MKNYRTIWDAEKDNWIIQNKHLCRKEGYKQFLLAFPDVKTTAVAFEYRCKYLRCLTCPKKSRIPANRKPLYSEQIKKGYVKIKIAQPSVWVQKSQWVYMETHPWEDFTEPSRYFFLDGDARNFNPANIERVPLKLVGIFARLGGTAKGNPDLTKVRILQAKLTSKLLDVSEAQGFTFRRQNGARVFLKTPFQETGR